MKGPMNPRERANQGIPADVRREITRYGGLNPHREPAWRVVLAQNVLEQSFGTMRVMPKVSADADIMDIEPERYQSGELWTPRYADRGYILERWFPPAAWGDRWDWEHEIGQDGQTRLKGEWPRHGDYYMVSEEFLLSLAPVEHWKTEIAKELRRMARSPQDPATYLKTRLYLLRVEEEERQERFLEEVNHIHRGTVEPMLATVGRTAQMVRNQAMDDAGLTGHLSAG